MINRDQVAISLLDVLTGDDPKENPKGLERIKRALDEYGNFLRSLGYSDGYDDGFENGMAQNED